MNLTSEEIWAAAREQPHGLRIPCLNPVQLHKELVAFRATSANGELYQFSLQVKGEEVWLVRSTAVAEVRVDGAFRPLEE